MEERPAPLPAVCGMRQRCFDGTNFSHANGLKNTTRTHLSTALLSQ